MPRLRVVVGRGRGACRAGMALAALVLCALASAPAASAAEPLRGQWHLDASGNVAQPDASGNGHTANPVGASFTFTGAGRFGGAYQFPSKTSYFNAGNAPELQPANVSVVAWVRKSSLPGPVKYIISQGRTNGCSHASYGLYTGYGFGATLATRFYIFNGTGTFDSPLAPNSIWDGNWHMLAGTYDGAKVRLFVDGSEVGSGTPASGNIGYGLAGHNDLIIGSYNDPACVEQTNFDGDIDEPQIYSRALTAPEITRLADPTATSPPIVPADAPPPPKNPAVNLRAPAISDVFITKTLPRYLCDAGLWQNSVGPFTYAWYRLDRPVSIFKTLATTTKVATTVTYDLPAADIGKEFYCEASAVGADGRRVTVASPRRILTGQKSRISLFTTKTYGNVQVRGIDVFQTVQPDAQTQTFGWDRRTYFGLCGGGTPTAFSPGASTPTAPCGSSPEQRSDPQSVTYNGVDVDARKDATAIVYVNTTDGPPADPNAKLLLRLRGIVKDKVLPDPVTTTITGIRQRSAPFVTASERADPTSAFRVRIPWSWLNSASKDGRLLDLEASVSISIADTGFQECSTGTIAPTLGQPAPCSKDNTFRLGFIPVYDDLPNLVLRPLPMTGSKQAAGGVSALQGPNSTLRVVTDLFPGGNRFAIEPFSAPLDITSADTLTINDKYCETFKAKKDVAGSTDDLRGCKMAKVGALVDTWIASDKANRTGYDALVGIHDYNAAGGDEPGWKPSGAELRQTDRVPRLFVNDGTLNRPFTAAAHEFGHLLNAPHADPGSAALPAGMAKPVPDPVSGAGCGGNSNGQVGEAWPPDNFGRLQGYAFGFYDGKTGSPRGTDVQRDNSAAVNKNFALWDFMSYCAPEDRAWISAKNWKRYFDELQFLNARGRPTFKHQAAATASGQAFAVGSVGPGGVTIDRVVPASPGNGVPASVAGSSLKIAALGPGGTPLATTGADVQFLQDGPAGVGSFTAPLPAGAVAVEAREGGRTLARVQRTTPPKVTVSAPTRGTRAGGGARSKLVVAWKTTDPDSRDRLARVEYAADGRRFRTVWMGKDTGRVSLAGSSLAAATKARVRVVVNDGFTDGSGVSAPFRADGAPPVVTITSPAVGERLPTGVRALLMGYATDDRGQNLGGRSLTWFAGRTRLGRGARLTATLPTGTVRLRLVARDRLGRTTAASRTVQVARAPLYVTTLAAPARVVPRAKTVRVRIAASGRATLKVGRRAYAVGTKPRTLTLALPRSPKTGSLAVPFTVRAKGSATVKGVVRVVRV